MADVSLPAPMVDAAHAPIIYFESAPNFGCGGGIVNVTLAVGRHLAIAPGTVSSDVLVAAYLRCNLAAAVELRNALNAAILIGMPPAGGAEAN